MLRIPFGELHVELSKILKTRGFRQDRAEHCARLFAEASRDGVHSHGLNRFPRFCEMIRNGSIDIHAEPECIAQSGALERWNGRSGPGNLNAHFCMARAIDLAGQYGVGGVALSNTNHWMRGGTYGWQAADAGMIGICWTNTLPNMPAWGSSEPRLGNNPLVVAVPRPDGHIVLDMSVAQFSYGTLESYRSRDEPLPVDGGFDSEGRLTRDPGAIEESGRPLPIGYWKGSGLSLVLDLMAAMLSGGLATYQINTDPLKETGLSQIFLAFDPSGIGGAAQAAGIVEDVVNHLHGSRPVSGHETVRHPGEATLARRRDSLTNGVPVEPEIWDEIRSL